MAGKPGWGAWAEHATCGRDDCKCVGHRINSEKLQGKFWGFTFANMIGENYTTGELMELRSVANGMG